MHTNIAGLRRNIKNFTHSYSDAQVKAREATSNDPWGPSSTLLAEVSDLTYNVVAFSEIMSIIWKRLNDSGKNWRHVYKALILLDYLIKTGSERVAQQCKENIYVIQTLREFQYYEEGKDQGVNVREKAKNLVSLLKNDERLAEERAKAIATKERFASGGPRTQVTNARPNTTVRPNLPPELAEALPADQDEEELQLQLALAMSREEAEAEEAKRRSDDVRLQMAISESQQNFQEVQQEPKRSTQEPKAPESNLMDLLDINFGPPQAPAPAPRNLSNNVVGWNNSDPWKSSADAWAIADSTESSPAHQPWNGLNNNPAPYPPLSNDSWMQDPFKTDHWNLPNNNTHQMNGKNAYFPAQGMPFV